MLTETGYKPSIREARAYGYETKLGPRGLEQTIARSEGNKDVEILTGPERIGNVFLTAQKRAQTGRNKERLIVSVWVSYPFVLAHPDNVEASFQVEKPDFLRIHRALRRLVRRKISKFFEDQYHA